MKSVTWYNNKLTLAIRSPRNLWSFPPIFTYEIHFSTSNGHAFWHIFKQIQRLPSYPPIYIDNVLRAHHIKKGFFPFFTNILHITFILSLCVMILVFNYWFFSSLVKPRMSVLLVYIQTICFDFNNKKKEISLEWVYYLYIFRCAPKPTCQV